MLRIHVAGTGLAVVLLFMSVAVEGQSPSPPSSPSPGAQAAALGTAADALAWLGSAGFSHTESTSTADGGSRWVATLPMTGLGADVSVELVGPPDALERLTIHTVLGAGSAGGSVIVLVLQRFAPDGLPFVVNALLRGTIGAGIEARAEGPDGTITVAVTRTEAEMPSDVTLPVSITIERPGPVAQVSPAASASVAPTDIGVLFPSAASTASAGPALSR